ncbi:MAG: phosphotransferase [Oscillatoriales cyanobacterium SM2_2_1]|nr:phosphotransferase [Oscillatoriales cyanobacterium SM2_2_1]
MDDKQKKIIGYFIEESKENLQAMEDGLINLPATLKDPEGEGINSIFRAAHSIKGSAAMLGLDSLKQLSHALEDHFRVLRDEPNFPVDQKLQSLFLKGCDKIKELLDHLEGPDGLSPQIAAAVMTESQPVLKELQNYMNHLAGQEPAPGVSAAATIARFQQEVPHRLRDLLNLFKQPDSPTSRQNLAVLCQQLLEMGSGLPPWQALLKDVKGAVTNPNNSFRNLAPVVIKEIKQAQDLVVAGKGDGIRSSATLKQLLPTVVVADPIAELLAPTGGSWEQLGDRLGWRQNGTWLNPNQLQFSGSAPEGHLPAPIWCPTGDLPGHVQALMAKIKSCK